MALSNNRLISAYKKKEKALEQTVEAQDNAFDAKITDARETTADNLQNLYLQNERARRTREQARKAAGITGGAAESADVAMTANYNSSRLDAMLARDRQVSDLNIQKEQARADIGVQKSANEIEMEQSALSFETDQRDFNQKKKEADRTYNANQAAQLKSEAWEMVRAGVINAEIARQIGRPISVLKDYYRRYKEMKS